MVEGVAKGNFTREYSKKNLFSLSCNIFLTTKFKAITLHKGIELSQNASQILVIIHPFVRLVNDK